MNLTIRDYYNISTIKTYYNEMFDTILDDLTNNGYSYGFLLSMNKFKNIIDYSKFIFSPRLVNQFEGWITTVNYGIKAFGIEDIWEIWSGGPCSRDINFFIYNIDMLNDQQISISFKMNMFLMKMIDNASNSSIVQYHEDYLLEGLKWYNLKSKQPHYNKSRRNQWESYPEIRIITRFVKQYITSYCWKKRILKKKHQSKYKEVIKELIYYPNLGVEYFKIIHNFNELKLRLSSS